MKQKDQLLIEKLYNRVVVNERYKLGTNFVEFDGDYVNEIMFYSDYDPQIVENWVKNNLFLVTRYVAMGEDLQEVGVEGVQPEGVYIFNTPTDFTQTALVVRSS
jgi:hypothetical protein